jgi:selenide,water dikinase
MALNLVNFPVKDLDLGLLREMLHGGAEKVVEAGACLAGGHSVEDPEPKYGLAVTGIVHPDRVLANGGARPGDALVLTKPLGNGCLQRQPAGKYPYADLGARRAAGDGRAGHGGVRGGAEVRNPRADRHHRFRDRGHA